MSDPLNYNHTDFRMERRNHIKAATDLCYGVECIRELKEAKTVRELDRILAKYRRKKYND